MKLADKFRQIPTVFVVYVLVMMFVFVPYIHYTYRKTMFFSFLIGCSGVPIISMTYSEQRVFCKNAYWEKYPTNFLLNASQSVLGKIG